MPPFLLMRALTRGKACVLTLNGERSKLEHAGISGILY